MAYDRQQILRVVAGFLAGGGVAAIVAASVTATTGSFDTLDVGAGVVNDVRLSTGRVESLVGDLLAFAVTDLGMSAGDDASLTTTDELNLSAGTTGTFSGGTSVGMSVAGGGVAACNAGGVALTASTAGDDITAVAADEVSLQGGVDSTMTLNAGGVSILANGAGDDVSITANDIGGLYVSGGGFVELSTTGAELSATSPGDTVDINSATSLNLKGTTEVYLNTPSAGRALVLTGTSYRLPATVKYTTADFTPGVTTEVTADSFTVPANAFDVNGETLHVKVWGTAAGNTNAKTWQVKIHATTCASGTSLGSVSWAVATDTNWVAEWYISRTGASTQDTTFFARSGGAAGTFALDSTTTSAITDTANLVVCVQVTNATSAADSTMTNALWEWL